MIVVVARKPFGPFKALTLFRQGRDTYEIAGIMNISEAEAYSQMSQQRETERIRKQCLNPFPEPLSSSSS